MKFIHVAESVSTGHSCLLNAAHIVAISPREGGYVVTTVNHQTYYLNERNARDFREWLNPGTT